MCITSPEYRNFTASDNGEGHELTDENIQAKKEAKNKKEAALESARMARLDAAVKKAAERKAISEKASAVRKAKRVEDDKRKSKKTPEELKEALRRNAVLARAAHMANVAKRVGVPANHIQEVRLSRKLSVTSFAKLLHVSHQSVYEYESGKLIMSERIQKRFEQFERDTKEVSDGGNNR